MNYISCLIKHSIKVAEVVPHGGGLGLYVVSGGSGGLCIDKETWDEDVVRTEARNGIAIVHWESIARC